MKVGVANGRGRLDRHRKRGWTVMGTWKCSTGSEALACEGAVLAYWEEAGAVACEPDEVPRGDGFTESVHRGRVDVLASLAMIQALHEDSVGR